MLCSIHRPSTKQYPRQRILALALRRLDEKFNSFRGCQFCNAHKEWRLLASLASYTSCWASIPKHCILSMVGLTHAIEWIVAMDKELGSPCVTRKTVTRKRSHQIHGAVAEWQMRESAKLVLTWVRFPVAPPNNMVRIGKLVSLLVCKTSASALLVRIQPVPPNFAFV